MRLSLALLPATVALGLLIASSAMASPASPGFGEGTGHTFGSRFPVATATTTSESVGHAYGSRFPVASPVAGRGNGLGS